jgi:hypothetical protein
MKIIAAAGLALTATLLTLLTTGLLSFHGWTDGAIGTNHTYCGYYVQSHQVSLYCEHAS